MKEPSSGVTFCKRALSLNGRELSLRKIENQFRSQGSTISRAALSNALDYFEDAFLVSTVRPLSRALASDPKVAAKIYAIDPGLVYANASAVSEDKGQLLEDIIYLEIRRRNPYHRENFINSYKTNSGYEVDFVSGDVLSDQSHELIQVCLSCSDEKTLSREVRALEEAMRERSVQKATIVTLDEDKETLTTDSGNIEIVPAWQWCLDRDR